MNVQELSYHDFSRIFKCSISHFQDEPTLKIYDRSYSCKVASNSENQQEMKYLFSPLYILFIHI